MNGTMNVIRFEVMRNIKKPSFWIAAVMIPIILLVYIWVCGLAGNNMGNSLMAGTDTAEMELAVADDSGYLQIYEYPLSETETKQLKKYESKDEGIKDIQDKKIDVFYYLPADFTDSAKVEVYVKPDNATLLDDYSAPIKTVLSLQATTEVPPIDLKIITGAVEIATTTYDAKDDHEINLSETVNKVIAPGLCIAIFYLLICVLGNRISVAITEEKENRISELILTSVQPTQLITGKIVSLLILGIIQLLVLVVPIFIVANTPAIDAVLPAGFELKFDTLELIKYGLILLASYYMFISFNLAIGSIAPTAKDASSYAAIIVIPLVVVPFLFMSSFSGEPQFITYFLTYCPLTAPLSIMFRGIFGSLASWEIWVCLADLIFFSAISTVIATRLFRRYAINFTSKVSFKKLMGAPRKSWKK